MTRARAREERQVEELPHQPISPEEKLKKAERLAATSNQLAIPV